MKSRLKVLLLDLPAFTINLNNFRERVLHIPLACAYMKAYADASGLADLVDIEIAPKDLMNMAGDSGIIAYLIEKKIDMAGFSLYQWNALRSLHIMREVKKSMPAVRFIAGGPEISPGNDYLVSEEALDFMIEGEGEEPFRKLLLNLLGEGPSLDAIAGLMYRDGDRFFSSSPPEAKADITGIPSPYLNRVLRLDDYRYLFIETMRGCRFNCRYCSWKRGGRPGVAFFPLERIREELRLARENHLRFVSLADSGTNVSRKWLEKLCRVIIEENEDHFLQVHTYLHPELIDEESAQWLKEANFRNPTIGLQTTNNEALKAIGRKANLQAYLRGTSILRKYGIGFGSTIILGLPGDDLAGFRKTLDFLEENEQKSVTCFPLSVAPNTCFREEALELGIRYQKMPPNLVLSTSTMSFMDIKEGIRLFREKFCLPGGGIFEKDLRYYRSSNFPPGHFLHGKDIPSLVTYADGKFPQKSRKRPSLNPLKDVLPPGRLDSLNKIILSARCRAGGSAHTGEIAALIAPRLCWNSVLWVSDFGSERDALFLKELLFLLSRDNPFHIWHIVLEFSRELPLEYLGNLPEAAVSLPGLLDFESIYERENCEQEYHKILPFLYAVVPYKKKGFSSPWLSELRGMIPLIWSYVHPGPIDEIPEGTGYLVDFAPGNQPSQVLFWLNIMRNSGVQRPILFRNWIMERLWNFCYNDDFLMRGAYENVMEIEGLERAVFTSISKSFLQGQLLKWVISREKGS